MNNFQKIVAAQDRILQELAACESLVADLYSLYKERQPNMAELWDKLSREERQHARLIEGVRNDLTQGELMNELGQFNLENIQHLCDYIRTRIDEARSCTPSHQEAVDIALSIEASIIDSRFFDFVHSNGSSFQQAASQLAHETKHHIQMIQDMKLALLQSKLKSPATPI